MNFISGVDNRPLTLTVQVEVTSRVGLKRLGKATHVFTFQPTDSTTRPTTPSPPPGSTDDPALSMFSTTAETSENENETTATLEAVARSFDNSELSIVSAAGDTGENESGETATVESVAEGPDVVVFVHDRYNGHKEIYLNRRLVYEVKKECTDGSMNLWALRLSFGRVVLRLISKAMSTSGFEYTMRLGSHDGMVLYKAT